MSPRIAFIAGPALALTITGTLCAQTADREVQIGIDDQGACTALVMDQPYRHPYAAAIVEELERSAPASLRVALSPEVPWRCVGGLTFMLQGRGYTATPIGTTEWVFEREMDQEAAE